VDSAGKVNYRATVETLAFEMGLILLGVCLLAVSGFCGDGIPVGVREDVAIVLGKGAERYVPRQEAAERLGADLTDREYSLLLRFLRREAAEDSVTEGELRALKNEVINVLKRQPRNVGRLVDELLGLCRNGGTDEVMKEYGMQHLATLYRRADEQRRQRIRGVLEDGLRQKQASVAGTALIGLMNIVEGDGGERGWLGEEAAEIAGDEAYSDGARITALQVSSDRRLRKAAEAALERLPGRNARTHR